MASVSVCPGSYNKIPQNGAEISFLAFWRLEVTDQGASRFGSWLADGHLLIVSSHGTEREGERGEREKRGREKERGREKGEREGWRGTFGFLFLRLITLILSLGPDPHDPI